MSLPDVAVTVRDGALGLVPNGLNGQLAVIGPCSSGTGNTPTVVGDIQTLVTTFGSGPMVELGAHVLQLAGGPIVAMRVTTAAAGVNGSITNSGTGSSVLAVSAGTPKDDADVQVKITTAAAAVTSGAGAYQLSLDGGKTFGAITTVPTSAAIVLGNGTTVTFGTGTLVAGDIYSFHCTAPAFTNTELATAMDALNTDSNTWFAVAVAGIPADAATWNAMFTTLDTKMTAAETTYFRYAFALIAAPDLTDAAIVTAAASNTSKRVGSPGGFDNLTSAISGNAYKRPLTWSVAARLAATRPSEDPGRVASGPLQGVSAIGRDEAKTPTLDAARLTTAQTRMGLSGFYITQGRLMAAAGSDFTYIVNRRVVDLATAVGRNVLQQYVNESFRVNSAQSSSPGTILEQDARKVENRIDQAIRAVVVQPGDATDVSVVVDRTINILSTQNLKATIRVLPLGYARYITMDIGLTNPALTPV